MTKQQLAKLKRVFINEYDIEIEKVIKTNIRKINNENIKFYHQKILDALSIKNSTVSKYFEYENFYNLIIHLKKQ